MRIERLVLGPIVEIHPLDIVDEGFRRRVLGQDQRMIVQFDMVIGEDRRNPGLADDRDAIDQRPGVDQGVFDQYGVIGRNQKIAGRGRIAQRARLDADRQHAERVGETGRYGLAADPAHRLHAAVGGQDRVPGFKRFDGDFARRRADQHARHEADGIDRDRRRHGRRRRRCIDRIDIVGLATRRRIKEIDVSRRRAPGAARLSVGHESDSAKIDESLSVQKEFVIAAVCADRRNACYGQGAISAGGVCDGVGPVAVGGIADRQRDVDGNGGLAGRRIGRNRKFKFFL